MRDGTITWQNINAPQSQSSFYGMNTALEAINRGLGQVGSVFDRLGERGIANWEQQKANNTQMFLDRIAAAKTPEQMAALQASGELDALRSTFGAQFDARLAREAEDTRTGTLQDRLTKAIQYENTVREDKDRPIKDALLAKAALDPKGTIKAMETADISPTARAAIAQVIRANQIQDENTEESKLTNSVQRVLYNAQANELKSKQESRDAEQAQASRKEKLSALLWGSGDTSSSDGRKLVDNVLKGKDEKIQQSILNNLSEYMTGGIPIKDAKGNLVARVPMSADLFAEAVNATKDGWFYGDTHGARAKDWIERKFSNSSTRDTALYSRYLNGLEVLSGKPVSDPLRSLEALSAVPKPSVKTDSTTPALSPEAAARIQALLERMGEGTD